MKGKTFFRKIFKFLLNYKPSIFDKKVVFYFIKLFLIMHLLLFSQELSSTSFWSCHNTIKSLPKAWLLPTEEGSSSFGLGIHSVHSSGTNPVEGGSADCPFWMIISWRPISFWVIRKSNRVNIFASKSNIQTAIWRLIWSSPTFNSQIILDFWYD